VSIKKNLATAQLFYRRKKIFLFAKELLATSLKKKSDTGSTFLFAKEKISIRERTFGHLTTKKNLATAELFYRRKKIFLFAKELLATSRQKKIWRRLNFSFRDSYRRKNF